MTNHAAQLAIIKHVTRQESRSSAGPEPQATLALAGVSRTGLIPGLLGSLLLLPETLSLDPRLCFYAGPGEGVWKASLTGKWTCFLSWYRQGVRSVPLPRALEFPRRRTSLPG